MKILVSTELGDAELARIREAAGDAQVEYVPHDESGPMDPDLLRDVDVLLCQFPPENFEAFENIKWVQVTSAGYAQLLDLGLPEKGIAATNGLGVFDIPIAEWNILMLLYWHRHMPEMEENQRQHNFDRSAQYQREIRGSVVGFYGYGGLARETARLAKTMGIEVWVLTRNGSTKAREGIFCVEGTGDPEGVLPDRVFSADEDEAFLSGVDYLVLSIPLTPATEGLIGERELKLMKDDAVLLNPARGPIVQLEALIQCMEEGWIRGASLDTHYAYPLPEDHPVWELPNTMLTPHISGSALSPKYPERVTEVFVQNLGRFQAGKPFINRLSDSQLRGE